MIYGKQHLPKKSIGFKKCDTTSVTSNIQEVGPKNIQKLYNSDIHANFGKNYNQKYLE